MGTKIESWKSNDGVLFTDEKAMVLHEINITIGEEFPDLKIVLPSLMKNALRLSEIMQPLLAFIPKDHPEVEPKTTPTFMHDVIEDMRANEDFAAVWLANRGYAGLLDFNDRATRADMDRWFTDLAASRTGVWFAGGALVYTTKAEDGSRHIIGWQQDRPMYADPKPPVADIDEYADGLHEDVLCDCSALMNGDSVHDSCCSTRTKKVTSTPCCEAKFAGENYHTPGCGMDPIKPSDEPKLDTCPGKYGHHEAMQDWAGG